MKRILLVAAIMAALFAGNVEVGSVEVSKVEAASAHTSYAGHTCRYWDVTSPTSGAVTKYRECLIYQAGCTNHTHTYLTEYRRYTVTNGYFWQDIHQHIRGYACHAV